jgi:alpha-tubulin suppressor-like RCC1 family protein
MFGRNNHGQLGTGDFTDRYESLAQMTAPAHCDSVCLATVAAARSRATPSVILSTQCNCHRWRPTEVAPTYTGEDRENFRAIQVVCGKQHTLGLIANKGRVMSFACGE